MSYKKSYYQAGQRIFAPTAKVNAAVQQIFCFFLMMVSFSSVASAEIAHSPALKPAFFESLYDVPVMAGLKEIKSEAVLFDKPDGKIAYVKAVSKNLTKGQILAFYGQTLPQMGWQKIKENQYIRSKERLEIGVATQYSFTIVEFTLSPAQ